MVFYVGGGKGAWEGMLFLLFWEGWGSANNSFL